jgi:hypothetical protein
MNDYRKMLVAQIAACNDYDGGAPHMVEWFKGYLPFTDEEKADYEAINEEAEALCKTFRKSGT